MRAPAGAFVVGVACVLGLACATPDPARPALPTAPPAAAPPVLADAEVIARSRAWLTAFDRHDGAIIDALAPSFVQFEHGRFFTADVLARILAGRRERSVPSASRAFAEERVHAGPGVATYITHSSLTVPAGGAIAGPEGHDTLVWSHDGTRWQLAHWQWQRAGLDAERERWNEVYRQGVAFNKQANQLLVETVKGRTPGATLNILIKQKHNTLFLTSQN